MPIPEAELKSVETKMDFTYKQGIGELIYAMITYCSGISFSFIKLNQYSTKPAQIHFEA